MMNKLANILILSIALLLGGASLAYAQSSAPRIKGNVYGGGENAKVLGKKLNDAGNWVDDHGDGTVTTKVTINNGEVCGDVYGAGMGVSADVNPENYTQVATVNGNTEVNLDALKGGAEVKTGKVWGDIYGGAALAIVEGNTNVNIAGGKFAGDVFGGGKGMEGTTVTSADVKKNTYVNVTDGEIIWDQKLDADKEVVAWEKGSNDDEFFDKENLKYVSSNHNIYAGGNIACSVGKWNAEGTQLQDASTGSSVLKMARGLLDGDLIGSDHWKMTFTQHENPHFYAFGGGYGIHTKAHQSNVEIFMPMEDSKSETGGDQQLARPRRAQGNGTVIDIDIVTDDYGLAWTTVLGVLGGGYNGHVEKTNVLVGDGTYAHRVYGGGLGSYEGLVEANLGANAPGAYGKLGTVGPLVGEPSETEPVTHVILAGGHIHGDVFGGGAGVAPRKIGGSSDFTDFTEIARVKGNTLVETFSYRGYKFKQFYEALAEYIAAHGKYETPDPNNKNLNKPDQYFAETDKKQHALVYGNVYGGGDVANVTGNTKVWYHGGKVFGTTFGAGFGRLASQANDYTLIGRVTGNSEVELNDTIIVPLVKMENLPDVWQEDKDVKDVTSRVYEDDNYNDNDDSYPDASKHCYFVVQDATKAAGIGINFKPHAWGDIYGGGRNGVTGGDATVIINGGLVGNNVFGGGLGDVSKDAGGAEIVTSADVKGNTSVTVRGGQYLWRQIADIKGNIKNFPSEKEDTLFNRNVIDNKMKLTPMFEPIKDFFNYNTASYTRDHSIYGGGNVACIVGTYANGAGMLDAVNDENTGKSTVDMQHGLFAEDSIHWTDDEKWSLATLCRWLACENSANYQFGVFGGGYGAHTKVGSTNVVLRMGFIELLKEKAEEEKKEEYESEHPGSVYVPKDTTIWQKYMGTIMARYARLSKAEKDEKYGGESDNGLNRYLSARMSHSINVPKHTVLTTAGGGLAGYVAGSTNVSLERRSGALRIYGGGIGMKPTPEQLSRLDQTGAYAFTYGQVGANTNVNVEYGVVVKDVFGGGAGVESMQNDNGEYVDFTEIARVKGKTEVYVHATDKQPTQTLVYGSVFGGGDVANVGDSIHPVETPMEADEILDTKIDPRTKVTIGSGCVFKDVFAGGSGRASELCRDYTTLGGVFGNTHLVIEQPAKGGDNSTWLWKDVYGGGQNGTVYGNTLVQITGGWLGSNVFGGGLGNIGSKYDPELGKDVEKVTAANVTQNSNVRVTGGQYCISQTWDEQERDWKPANKKEGSNALYSSQYDPNTQKFLVSHNIYGGGNMACAVQNNTYVDMRKGLLPSHNRLGNSNTTDNFFQESEEWHEIHDKHASPFFSVFGGGYGENATVSQDSHVTINIEGDELPAGYLDPTEEDLYKAFYDRQSLLDVIGGGYEGTVGNTCHIDIKGNSFMRNVFGGAYYATVGNTIINATRGNMENIYGGGMMGDVHADVSINFGQEHGNSDSNETKTAKTTDNSQLVIMQSIYGGNDVSGYVGAKEESNGTISPTPGSKGVTMRLYGGTILGSVYGGGNGNYLYHIDQDIAKVTAVEDYEVGDGERTLVYNVPLRSAYFPSFTAMSDQQKMVNLASYRPNTNKVDIKFKGNSGTEETLASDRKYTDRLTIKGNLFGGGNSATISRYTTDDNASVKIDAGSHATLGGLFLGSDGDALFDATTSFIEYYSSINNMKLYQTIDWEKPENRDIHTLFLPTPVDERPNVYKNNVDLYFLPIEMSIMPEMTWNGRNSSISAEAGGAMNADFTYSNPGVQDLEIGTFCCGGNRGNMNTPTRFHIYFPEGLTIKENVIGGCNNANFNRVLASELDADGNPIELKHIGGFLLGTHNVGTNHEPQINLTLRNKFHIEKEKDANGVEQQIYPEKCNVFGGCYTGGNVRGDVRIDVFSNMLMSARDNSGKEVGLDSVALRRATDASRTVCGIYGGGYGPNTWVFGDTEVRLGTADETCSSSYATTNDGRYNTTGASCNYIFGGGREGNIVGNSTVRLLNGRVGGCVVGASYSGTLYGNSQVIVGYPKEYYVCEKSGKYDLIRTDKDPQHLYYVDGNGKPVIKQSIWHTKGDLVSKASFDEIKWSSDITDEQKKEMFPKSTYITYPTAEQWQKVNIQIDKAVYGGGYAIAGGGGVGSGSYTVRKYTSAYNLNEYAHDKYGLAEEDSLHDDHGAAYGGNTIVLIGDRILGTGETEENDHITVSSSQLKPITPTEGQNLFGKYRDVPSDNGTPNDKSDDFTTVEYIRTDVLYKQSEHGTTQFYEYTGEGGIYGDGHLSLSEGFRLSDIAGYGYNGTAPINAKLMNCLHRFDIVRLEDCCFSLLGDRDYASEAGSAIDATPYSIANVGEIKMYSSLDKNGNTQLMDPLKNKRSRNYMGLSNRVTNIGSVFSNVSFTDRFHHGNEGKYNDPTSKKDEYGVGDFNELTYKEFKKKMIETYYDCSAGKVKDVPNAAIRFQLRNDGTAKNLIGIGSGYALFVEYAFDRMKTQHILDSIHTHVDASITTIPDNQGVDGTYYGPVDGVFEVNLISVREGEAGGYVYAQNMHTNEAYEVGGHTTHFLNTSGNFVFPVTTQRKVIDDCFPVKYTGTNHHEAADGHYWYVSGLKYFFNATITGYTFNDTEMKFDMPNANLITLTGAKEGQNVYLKDFHIINRHASNTYECDFEREVDGDDNTSNDLLYQGADGNSKVGKYMFSISTSGQTTYTDSVQTTVDGKLTNVAVPHLETMTLNDLAKGQDTKLGEYKLPQNDACISIRLTDNVNNNGKLDNGKSYYETYLSDPCQAVILLTVPAQDDNGFDVYNNDMFVLLDEKGETPLDDGKRYYIQNFDGTFLGVKDDELESYKDVKDGDGNVTKDNKEMRKILYVLKDYRPLTTDEKNAASPDDKVEYYLKENETYTKVTGDQLTSAWTNNKANLYVKPTSVNYEYTIDLSIRYIKGPSHSGHINIKNCALPGEMIRFSHENVVVESDENSLPHNGNFWIIGPGKKVKDAEGEGWHWEFVDDYQGVKNRTGVDLFGNANTELHYTDPESRNIYYPYNPFVTDPLDPYRNNAFGSIAKNGIYHAKNADAKDYFLPANYYMDGYVAQYCYTVQGIQSVFRTDIQAVDTLTVHNYHRMANVNDMITNTGDKSIPHDLFVPMAARAAVATPSASDAADNTFIAYGGAHHRPRVYIQDVNDLRAFAQYLQRSEEKAATVTILPKGTTNGSGTLTEAVTFSEVEKLASDYGANTDFFLMANITVPNDWTPIANFKGRLHGNGHVISGLGNKALFTDIDVASGAHIYNLGLPTGMIATAEKPTAYSNCYTFANRTVYHMDGSADNHYTEDDWRTGRVAYDLNEYYLAERLDRGSNTSDTHDHNGYVESLYANGDYRYARFNSGNATSEYLRNVNNTPLYGWYHDQTIMETLEADPDAHISRHAYTYDMERNVLGHSVDESRAYYKSDGDPEHPVFQEYRPLLNEAKVNSAATLTDVKNDYIFFGQTINKASYTNALASVGSNIPTVIDASSRTEGIGSAEGVTHNIADQANRIWRAYGFYQSKADDAFHFNKAAWALHPELTAIDFTGQHDAPAVAPNPARHTWQAGFDPATATGETSRIFYPMVMDMPDAITSFNVYSNKDVTATYSNANVGYVTQNLLVYNNSETVFDKNDTEGIAEKEVVYHNLKKGGDPEAFSTDYFHLVDKQDFNAPIEFKVNTRAWYERIPKSYRNVSSLGYESGSAWEGIALPFTATKVTADVNGEISHFYGADNLHHEYWLRGFKSVNGDKATFAHPAKEGDNYFVTAEQTDASSTYSFPANEYFTKLINYNANYDSRDDEGDDEFDKHDAAYYAKSHEYSDYVYLTAATPYIVAFPGNDFYEFSMEGTEYDRLTHSKTGAMQKVTFENGENTIRVSDDSQVSTASGNYSHHGTYMRTTGEYYGINDGGSAFDGEQKSILPFRTYMTSASSANRHIYIDELPHAAPDEQQPDDKVIEKLLIYVDGTNLVVESPVAMNLPVYSVSGTHVANLHIEPGVTIHPLQPGIYIVHRKKYMLR